MKSLIAPKKVCDLLLALDNPRFEPCSTQTEAYETIINELGDKFINLADDIVDKGLNPSKVPLITPDENNPGKFIVCEGNRRVAALKLLSEPAKIDELKIEGKYKKKLKELAERGKGDMPEEIDCASTEREDANYWVSLEHSGQKEGVAVVPWDGIARHRFEGSSPALQAIDLVKESKYIDSQTQTLLSNISITNVERVLGTKDARDILGVDVKDKKLVLKQPEDEALYHLAVLVTDIATKTKKVTQLDSKEQRIAYAETIAAQPFPKVEATSGTSGKADSNKGKSSGHPKISRNTLIPIGLHYQIGQPRLAKIFDELQHMNLESYINACSVMLRVFIEMSVDDFAQRNNINLCTPVKNPKPGIHQQTLEMNLRKKLETVVKYLEENNLCSKDELYGVKTIISNKNHVLSVDNLNAYVHNKDYSPTPSDLKLNWDSMQIFVQKLWGLF